MFIVISLGGSLVNPGKPDIAYLKNIAKIIRKSKHNFGIVCGGGRIARDYAEAVRSVGGSEFDADEAAVISTKQNARLVIAALDSDAYPKVLNDFVEAKEASLKSRIVVMGGTVPGITTDTDSVLLAEALGAERIVNLSNVDAIYSANPAKHPDARKYGRITFEQLVDLAVRSDNRRAGENFIFDVLACKLIARSKIESHFVSGKKLKDVEAAIEGKKHTGTIVKN